MLLVTIKDKSDLVIMDKDDINLYKSEVKCLRCDKLFLSQDRRINRICKKCAKLNDKEYSPRVVESHIIEPFKTE